jgi:cell division protein FtsB
MKASSYQKTEQGLRKNSKEKWLESNILLLDHYRIFLKRG